MKPPAALTIFDLADYFGLRIEYHDLPATNAGFLDPDDEKQFIAVNRNLPHCEHVFTIAHELCHVISDHERPRRKYRSRLLEGQYESRSVKKYIHLLRYIMNKILPIEREADMFAMSWLVQREGGKVLLEFLDRHPEKKWLFTFILLDCLVRLPFRLVKTLFGKLLLAQAKT